MSNTRYNRLKESIELLKLYKEIAKKLSTRGKGQEEFHFHPAPEGQDGGMIKSHSIAAQSKTIDQLITRTEQCIKDLEDQLKVEERDPAIEKWLKGEKEASKNYHPPQFTFGGTKNNQKD